MIEIEWLYSNNHSNKLSLALPKKRKKKKHKTHVDIAIEWLKNTPIKRKIKVIKV